MNTTNPDVLAPKGLLARAVGVFFSPRETYTDIAARPRPLGAILLVIGIIALANYLFLSTAVGQRALLDAQATRMEAFGRPMNAEQMAMMERMAPWSALSSVAGIVIFVPLVMAIMAGLLLVVFNAVLGGDARFKQVFAIIAYSGFIGALQQVFVMPLNYVRESMTSATSLAVFLPMADDSSFLGMLLGSIDLFRIWSLIITAIGLGVLYKRRTAPIAWSLLGVALVIVLIITGVRVAISGA